MILMKYVISLVHYIIKALMKEGIGNDNLAIAWAYPGKVLEAIPATFSMVELTCAFDPSCGTALDTWTGIGGISIAITTREENV